jgi:hypothetical protein
MNRPDETWQRLLNWPYGQAPSERLAGQILLAEGFKNFDPSHPLGGRDGGMDALCMKDGQRWIMAAYFPCCQQTRNSLSRAARLSLDWMGQVGGQYCLIDALQTDQAIAARLASVCQIKV